MIQILINTDPAKNKKNISLFVQKRKTGRLSDVYSSKKKKKSKERKGFFLKKKGHDRPLPLFSHASVGRYSHVLSSLTTVRYDQRLTGHQDIFPSLCLEEKRGHLCANKD